MDKETLAAYITEKYADLLTLNEQGKYDLLYSVPVDKIRDVCQQMHDDDRLTFDFLCNISGIDTGEQFEIEYNLASTLKKHRIDLRVVLPYNNAHVDSVTGVWEGANWFEREIWELYGINIRNHGNLTRFLLPDDWNQGHPMRKDWDAPDFIRMPEL